MKKVLENSWGACTGCRRHYQTAATTGVMLSRKGIIEQNMSMLGLGALQVVGGN